MDKCPYCMVDITNSNRSELPTTFCTDCVSKLTGGEEDV